jgi:hypothetical protein
LHDRRLYLLSHPGGPYPSADGNTQADGHGYTPADGNADLDADADGYSDSRGDSRGDSAAAPYSNANADLGHWDTFDFRWPGFYDG